jgi:hypothetical protein
MTPLCSEEVSSLVVTAADEAHASNIVRRALTVPWTVRAACEQPANAVPTSSDALG